MNSSWFMCSGSLTLAATYLHPSDFAKDAARILVSSDVVLLRRKSAPSTPTSRRVSTVLASPVTVITSYC